MSDTNGGYKIDKNVPLPGKQTKTGHYPLMELEVGDSFFVPVNGEKETTVRNRVWARVQAFLKQNAGKKFATRLCEGGFRIWRTA